jgi:hypothetical protein
VVSVMTLLLWNAYGISAVALLRVPGLPRSSEDFLYTSDNVRDSFFLLPIIGPQRIGGPFGGHGVFFMVGAGARRLPEG